MTVTEGKVLVTGLTEGSLTGAYQGGVVDVFVAQLRTTDLQPA